MNLIELSIIVPAYNCEKSICRCINSILKSEYKDYEIIIINDCSTDETINIIKTQYYNKKNIVIIDLEKNKGVSYCRNIGIEKAKGNYITFIDSDDYVTSNIYSKMMQIVIENDLDCCVCDYSEIFPSTLINKSKYKYNNNILKKDECIKEFLIDNISPAIWDKIFKADILKEYVKFQNNLKVGEDILFCLEFFYRAKRVYLLNEVHYYYQQQEKSVMHVLSPKILQFAEIIQYIPEEQVIECKSKFKKEFEYFQSAMIMRGIHSLTVLLNNKNKKQCTEYLNTMRNLQLLKIHMKNKYTSKFIKIETFNIIYFGIRIHMLLSPLYVKVRKTLRRIR